MGRLGRIGGSRQKGRTNGTMEAWNVGTMGEK
jgi:hypothetical protein